MRLVPGAGPAEDQPGFDDTEPHPYAVAEETAMLAPNAQMTFFPWKEAKDRVPLAVRHLRTFLKANRPS